MGLSDFKTLEDAVQEIFRLRRMNQQLADERNDALSDAKRWQDMQSLTAKNRELIQAERDTLRKATQDCEIALVTLRQWESGGREDSIVADRLWPRISRAEQSLREVAK